MSPHHILTDNISCRSNFCYHLFYLNSWDYTLSSLLIVLLPDILVCNHVYIIQKHVCMIDFEMFSTLWALNISCYPESFSVKIWWAKPWFLCITSKFLWLWSLSELVFLFDLMHGKCLMIRYIVRDYSLVLCCCIGNRVIFITAVGLIG